jgi:capsular polysaccharide biosynthesis protein
MLASAKMITPFVMDGHTVCGAAYDAELRLVLESLRDSTCALYRHRDHAYLMPGEVDRSLELQGARLYLGHCFGNYGHFLLETLPMLAYLLRSEFKAASGVFLPWGEGEGLMRAFTLMLGIDSKVEILKKLAPCTGNFLIPDRPIRINGFLKNREPYTEIIRAVKSTLGETDVTSSLRKVFLKRKNDRVAPEVSESIEGFLADRGFAIVVPELLTIPEQIALMDHCNCLVGFAGSQLHNSIFMNSGTQVIEIGDRRSPESPLANQVICSEISGGHLLHSRYSDNPEETMSSLKETLVSL